LAPAVSIRRSVQPDSVACLECGFRGKTLRRHLRSAHGLDPAAYRARWKLAVNYPLTAPAYSAHRSAMAKQLGLGRPRSSSLVNPVPAPARRGRSRKPAAAP
jgi:predicted transcriptional regulator